MFVQLPREGVGACVAIKQPLDSIAQRLGGIPVVFGDSGVIRVLSAEAILDGEFSPNRRPSSDLTLSFTGLEAREAILLVARAARLDVAIPYGLAGEVTGQLSGASWEDALNEILELAGADLRPALAPNGLVIFEGTDLASVSQ